jgi:hypothetical protein
MAGTWSLLIAEWQELIFNYNKMAGALFLYIKE